MLSSSARKFPLQLSESLRDVAGVFREHGPGFVPWTLAIGYGLAASMLSTFGSTGPYPHPFTLEKHPYVLFVLLTFATFAFAFVAAVVRRRRSPRGLLALYAENVRAAAPLAVLPLVAAFRDPLERSHSGIVIAIAAIAGAVTAYSPYS